MAVSIDLTPEQEQILQEQASINGLDLAGYLGQLLRVHLGDGDKFLSEEDLIDYEAIASCQRTNDESITLERVRAGTASIKDSMARVIIEEERTERF